MAESSLRMTYRGPALNQGTMAVQDLAPALLSMGAVFSEASALLYPEQERVGLNIKATAFGSFDVHLLLDAKGTWDQLIGLFSSKQITALLNLRDTIVGGAGLLAFILQRHGRSIARRSATAADGVLVEFNDGETVEVTTEVLRLYDDISIRRNVRKTLDPLSKDGIDVIEISSETTISVHQDDLAAFDVDEDEAVNVVEVVRMLNVVSPTFKEDNKWRFSDGSSSFYARVDDHNFLARVEARRELFGSGDLIRARVRETQTADGKGRLRVERIVVEVLGHEHAPEQLHLDGGDETEAEPGPGSG